MVLSMFAACSPSGGETASNASTAGATPNTTVNSGVIKESDANASAGESANASESTVIADTIKVAGTDPTNLDPFYGSKSQKNIFFMVYQRLYGMDNNGQLYGILAKDYTVDDSGLVYTVNLYPGIHDQAGNAFTAKDVVFSYKKWKEEGFANNIPKLDIDTGIVAVNDNTVQFTFKSAIDNYNELFYYFGQNDLTTEAAYNASPSKLASDSCGTGPYKITNYTPGVSITFTKYDDYWQTDKTVIKPAQQANVKTIVYNFIAEAQQKQVALQTGAVDFCLDLDYSTASDFMSGGKYANGMGVYQLKNNDINIMMFNCDASSPMSDENLRLAVGYSINNDAWTSCIGKDVGSSVYGMGGSRYFDYDPKHWEGRQDFEHTYDLDLAKQTLAKSGYNGQTIKILCNTQDQNGARKTLAVYLGACLEKLGVKYTIVATDTSTEKTWRNDPSKWDIDLLGMNANDSLVNLWYAKFDYSSSKTGDKSWFGLKDDKMEELLTTARNVNSYNEGARNAFAEYCIDHAYIYTICEVWQCGVYNAKLIKDVAFTGPQSQFLPGAFTYLQ